MHNTNYIRNKRIFKGIIGGVLVPSFIIGIFLFSSAPSIFGFDETQNNQTQDQTQLVTVIPDVSVDIEEVIDIVTDNINITSTPNITPYEPKITTIHINPFITFSADPIEIEVGGTSTLTWNSTNTVSCEDENGISIVGMIAGSFNVAPSETTTYTKTCEGTNGKSVSESVTVTVKKAVSKTPSVTLSANPTEVEIGGVSTLTWNSTNTVSCQSDEFASTDTSGSFNVAPAETTTYSITCLGTNGNFVDSAVTVMVLPPNNQIPSPELLLTAIPDTIEVGGISILTWSAQNIKECSSTDLNIFPGDVSGSFEVTPIQTTEYSISCLGENNHTVTSSVVVTVRKDIDNGGKKIPSVSLSANPTEVEIGGVSTLTWNSTNTVSCQSDEFASTDTSGSFNVAPAETTTYSITCLGTNGNFVDSAVTVTVLKKTIDNGDIIPTVTLNANPNEINTGNSSVLTWSSTKAVSCTGTGFSTNGKTSGTVSTGNLSATQTYTIICTSSTGHSQSASTKVTVTPSNNNGGGGGGGSSRPNARDDSSQTSVNVPIVIDVLNNDTGTRLTIDSVNQPANGKVEFSPESGNVLYTPNNGFFGIDSFSYTVKDSRGRTDTATVTVTVGAVLGTANNQCQWLNDYLRIDLPNNPVEVMRLQIFLNLYEGQNLEINGIFNQNTLTAVKAFQEKYKSEILTPWGHTEATGYVYITTVKKINEIFCNTGFPLTTSQAQEINNYRGSVLASASSAGFDNLGQVAGSQSSNINSENPLGKISGDVIGKISEDTKSDSSETDESDASLSIVDESKLKALVSGAFTFPNDTEGIFQCLIVLALILVMVYILSNILVDKETSNLSDADTSKRKLIISIASLAVAFFGAITVSYYCVLLPILAIIIVLVVLLVLNVNKSKIPLKVEQKS